MGPGKRRAPTCICGYDVSGVPRAADGSAVCPECGDTVGHLVPRCEGCGRAIPPEARVREVVCEGCGAVCGRGGLPPFRRREWPRRSRLVLLLAWPSLLAVACGAAFGIMEPTAAVLPGMMGAAAAMIWSLVAPPLIVVAREPSRRRFVATLLLIGLAFAMNGAALAVLFGAVWFVA